MNKELLVKYLYLRKKQEETLNPYYKLFDGLTLQGTIDDANDFIRNLLGINDDIEDFLIDSFWNFEVSGNYHVTFIEENNVERRVEISNLEELADFIIEYWKEEE